MLSLRDLGLAAVVGGAVLCGSERAATAADMPGTKGATDVPVNPVKDGQAGFVMTHFEYALAADADKSGACPDGMTSGYTNSGEVFVGRPDLGQQDGEQEQTYLRRVFASSIGDPSVKNLCLNPELGKPDPNWRSVKRSDIPVKGIDLDGQDSHERGKPAPNTCAHDDFRGVNGEHGIDNQFYRVVGCSKSFQSTGQSNTIDIPMYAGEWGILLTLKGVHDLRNSDNVEVGIYASADPLQLSPTRQALADATYAVDQDPRFRAVAHGRIVNGVLTTEPVDVRFHWIVNAIHLERSLQDARIRATFTPDGGVEGILGGYTSVESLYSFQYGFRDGTDATGQPAALRLRSGSAIGQARVLEHTCNGAYFELKRLADGHRDPKTGQCTSISTQYEFKGIPAFVVDVKTESANQTLDKSGYAGYGK